MKPKRVKAGASSRPFDSFDQRRYSDADAGSREAHMADWTKRVQEIQVGDTVAYSKAFLQSTGQYAGDVPHARGEVKALVNLGSETTLAEIEWDRPGIPERVNVKNLTTTRRIALGE